VDPMRSIERLGPTPSMHRTIAVRRASVNEMSRI
jgi:hypothetical protein